MNQVKVKRLDLIKKLKENRCNHKKTFESAVVVYRNRVIEELERRLKDARAGNKVNVAVGLPVPENHTSDYDTVIAMLEMSIEKEITVSNHEFSTYVLDKWGWAASFASNTSSYVQ